MNAPWRIPYPAIDLATLMLLFLQYKMLSGATLHTFRICKIRAIQNNFFLIFALHDFDINYLDVENEISSIKIIF